MNLSSKTTDKKLYSRFKHYDGMPYTSDDFHHSEDIDKRRLSLLIDSLAGSGLLESPVFETMTSNNPNNELMRLKNPIPVNIEGDIFLVGNSEGKYPVQVDINRQFHCHIFLISWYSHVTTSDTLYEYGGTCNDTIENNIIDETLNIQASSRYVRNWAIATGDVIGLDNLPIYMEYNNPRIDNIKNLLFYNTEIITNAGTIPVYDAWGIQPSDLEVVGKCYRTPATSKIPSEDGYVYIIPLGLSKYVYTISTGEVRDSGPWKSFNVPTSLYSVESEKEPAPVNSRVWYNPEEDTVKMYLSGAWRNVGGAEIIKSTTEPSETKEGTIWYNPDINEFRTYIEGLGYVESTAKVGFIQLQATHTFTQDVTTPQNIDINIPIETYLPTDILRVIYEGVELVQGVNYTLYQDNRLVVLNDFTVNAGDTLVFSIMRLVSSTDASTTARMLEDHMYVIGNSSANGHVRITDERSSTLNSSKGVAASPASVKAVEDMINVLTDDTTGKKYKLGISNGLLYYKEV